MIILRDYQEQDYEDIVYALVLHKGVLLSAPCGYGKSVMISHLANTLPGRVLVLTHRHELLVQNSRLMENYAVLNARTRKVDVLKEAKTVVCMAQTIIRRIEKYGVDYAGGFGTIIIDEAHLDYFAKIYNQLPHQNRIGLTATPVIDKKETKVVEGVDMVRKLSLADEYDFLVQGISEKELIERGYLVRDFNIQLTPPNLDRLINSSSNPDGYTSKSLTEVFGNRASITTLYEAYVKYGMGKKTIVFSPTTKANKSTYEFFKERLGEDKVRMFDSVNASDYTRDETVEWFRSVKDAVLLNVGVFSVGFDVPELEVILFNKKTKSLVLYLQVAGRGSRPAKEKTQFLFVDMGLNIQTHGKWSEERDWSKFFITHGWERKREADLLQIWECRKCKHWNLAGTVYNEELDCLVCANCGTPKGKRKESKRFIKGEFMVLEEPTFPKANALAEYVKMVGGDGNMMFRMAKQQILDLFRFYTTKEHFLEHEGKYARRVSAIFRPIYFKVLNDKTLKGKNRRLKTELKDIWSKVQELYT
jgi:superfamily II DNA or RNA helicase